MIKSVMPLLKLVVVADEPALLFSSISSAEGYLEAVDVENGVYPIAYDPTGKIYRLTTNGDHVVVEADSDLPADPDALQKVLFKLMTSRGFTFAAFPTLEDLIVLAEQFVDDW
ncbi:MAG TPA: hypothetical protein VF680_07880 [Allosphingosinicella sp.]|jgi:hypothetical protein